MFCLSPIPTHVLPLSVCRKEGVKALRRTGYECLSLGCSETFFGVQKRGRPVIVVRGWRGRILKV